MICVNVLLVLVDVFKMKIVFNFIYCLTEYSTYVMDGFTGQKNSNQVPSPIRYIYIYIYIYKRKKIMSR
jgi:hypothetical protein